MQQPTGIRRHETNPQRRRNAHRFPRPRRPIRCRLGLIGGWIGALLGYNWHWSLAALFGYVFAPFAYLLGIPWSDCFYAGELLGKKMVLNEFIAYAQMMEWSQPDSGVVLSERSTLILTYALCGFANFGSVGIQIGGIAALPQNAAQS